MENAHKSSFQADRHRGRLKSLGLFPALLACGLIRIYQLTLSFWLGRCCRYEPSCSHYTIQAIQCYGLWQGGWIGFARLCRCRPGGGFGCDPIPQTPEQGAKWYLPWRYGRWYFIVREKASH